ncbi:MAG: mannose-1-phosphate guanylyltransferase/mannose-6-phosphate isomerase [Betaproteobacteria bacterium]|nr:mannose-1-phosphate guanylyltransferase/mannose-6-phosphate isomerase [Betaproteobacteria bacterium]
MSEFPDHPPVAVILAGGSGTRLWPLSRQSLPKQFLPLDGTPTLLDATVERLQTVVATADILIVTSAAAARGEGLVHLAQYQTLLEPEPRNTAPAIGIAALKLLLAGVDPVMVVLPADHVIRRIADFHACLNLALTSAAGGKMVTFGITPRSPDTGFGYIKAGKVIANEVCRVEAFKEKPDLATATSFLAEGGYYWNSGMFVWRASVILAEIHASLPALGVVLDRIATAVKAGESFDAAVKLHFFAAPSISIDHGVLEKSSNLFLVPADIGWSDVGSWDAVYDIAEKDGEGNALRGDVLALDCRNSLIRSDKRLIAAVGMEDVSIVETADAILVSKRGESQKVKKIVEALQQRGGMHHIEHTTVRRPWGSYTVLEEGPGFKIKRIEVNPGGRLSLQSHRHRSEHWVVVAGTATVTCDGQVTSLGANQSTYIPIGAQHRLENLGAGALQIIEVQVGSYVGEDDIQRYDDQYGRVAAAEKTATIPT